MIHGLIRNRTLTVKNGKSTTTRKEIFCHSHGWIGLLETGEMPGFEQTHSKCLPAKATNAEVTGAEIYAGLSESNEKPFDKLSPKHQLIFNLLAETAQEILEEL